MRTIVLIEADHNMNNKLLGKRAMEYGELLHQHGLAPEQYGSRKHLSAAQALVKNRLMYDLMSHTASYVPMMPNRVMTEAIVHSVLSLSLQCLGVPQPPTIRSMLSTIQQMKQGIICPTSWHRSHQLGHDEHSSHERSPMRWVQFHPLFCHFPQSDPNCLHSIC